MRWAYGVTTVPERKDDLLPATLCSLREGGFPQPRLFVDGFTNGWTRERLRGINNLECTFHDPPLKTFGNWILGLWELYLRDPTADRYAMFQDDFLCYRNMRDYLESCPFPQKGYWNLITFSNNEEVIKGQPIGWHEAYIQGSQKQPPRPHPDRFQAGRGAVGLVFDRDGVQTVLHDWDHIVTRPTHAASGWRGVDAAVVSAMNKAGCREYIHNPSLLFHTGRHTTMGNRPHEDAKSFRGENFDALELLKECSAISSQAPSPQSA